MMLVSRYIVLTGVSSPYCRYPISMIYAVNQSCMPQSTYSLDYGQHVAQCHHGCCRVNTPIIHAVSHVNHRDVWFSIPMYAYGSVPIFIVLLLTTSHIKLFESKNNAPQMAKCMISDQICSLYFRKLPRKKMLYYLYVILVN